MHVRDVGLERADDQAIWDYAKAHGLTIITKDSDLHQLSFLYGHPPEGCMDSKGKLLNQRD